MSPRYDHLTPVRPEGGLIRRLTDSAYRVRKLERAGLSMPEIPKPEIVFPEEVTPGCKSPDLYDFYLSYRKGQPCWDGDNVHDTFQTVMDAVGALYTALDNASEERPISVWVDPWNGGSYGGAILRISTNVPNAQISFTLTSSESGSLIEGLWPTYLGTLHVGDPANVANDGPYVNMGFSNLSLDALSLHGAVAFVRSNHAQLYEIIGAKIPGGGAAEVTGGEFVDVAMYGGITFDIDGGIVNFNFKGGACGDIDVGYIGEAQFAHCEVHGVVTRLSLTDSSWDDIVFISTDVIGTYKSWMHVLGSFEDVRVIGVRGRVAGGADGTAQAASLVNFKLSNTASNNRGFTLQECMTRRSNAGVGYLISEDGGVEIPKEVFVTDNVFKSVVGGGTRRGAIGAFQDSVFGPNLPDDLDYSLVMGTNNKIHRASGVGGGEFTPVTLTDWEGSVDPGDLKDALDQLAKRLRQLEALSFWIWASSKGVASVANIRLVTTPKLTLSHPAGVAAVAQVKLGSIIKPNAVNGSASLANVTITTP